MGANVLSAQVMPVAVDAILALQDSVTLVRPALFEKITTPRHDPRTGRSARGPRSIQHDGEPLVFNLRVDSDPVVYIPLRQPGDGWSADVHLLATGVPVVSRVMTMLWTCGCGRPWGPQWCSKEAMTQRCGLIGENVVIPAFCSSSSAA